MIKKWLHLNELTGDPWILPIWSAIINATQQGSIPPVKKDITELGYHISTRLNILPRIIIRVQNELFNLYRAAERHETKHEFGDGKQGYAFPVDNDLKYKLLPDVDAFLFELNSVCELMTVLFEKLHRHAGQSIQEGKAGIEIKRVIETGGQNTDWFQRLDNHRNFFLHEGAPYFAMDISKGPGKYELIIMKENLKRFNDPKKYILLSELNEIAQGFLSAKPILQKALISLFEKPS